MREMNVIVEELQISAQRLSNAAAADFAAELDRAQRIFVYGTGRSGLMLKALAMRLMQLSYQVYVVGETITPSVQAGDLLIVASASGETGSVCEAAAAAKQSGASVLVITADDQSRLAGIQQPFMIIESATKFTVAAVSVQPLGSLFEQVLLVFFDGVSLYLSERSEGGNASMAKQHASIE